MPDYSNVTTLRLENNSGVIDPLAILAEMPANSRVRILGIALEAESDTEVKELLAKLDSMRGLDESGNNTDYAQVSGSVHVAEVSPGVKSLIATAAEKYPSLVISYDAVGAYETHKLLDRTITAIDTDVAAVGDNAFNSCTALASLTLRSAEVVTLAATNAFINTPIAKGAGYIYVPATLADGSDGVAAYQAATNWNTYADQIMAIGGEE